MKTYSQILLITLISIACYYPAQAQIITTIAGNGTQGYSGDGGPATAAALDGPSGVALDDSGNVYITVASAVRKINRAGIITTIAGTATAGYAGDGGPATAAALNYPEGIAVDKKHNIYIADIVNQRVRKIDAAGTITTFAGSGTIGFSGDGGPATAAQLNDPGFVTVDDTGNVYISDGDDFHVRKVDTFGIISIFAGSSNVYPINSNGDGGPATAGVLADPMGVAVDTGGNVLVADIGYRSIRKIDRSGILSTYPGSSGLLDAAALATDKVGNVFVNGASDLVPSDHIYKINAAGTRTLIAGGAYNYNALGDGGPAILATLFIISGLAIDGVGNIYVSDGGYSRLRKISGISGPASVCVNGTATLTDDITGGSWYSTSPAIAPVDAVTGVVTGITTGLDTIYYVIGSDTAYNPVTVINTLPVAAPISGPTALCAGSINMLIHTVNGGVWAAVNSYAVVSTTGQVTGVNPGIDTIVYINTNACGTVTDSFMLTVKGKNAGFITGAHSICYEDTATLTVTLTDTATGGVWASSNTSVATVLNGGQISIAALGSDTITYTVTNSGCTDIASFPISVKRPSTIGPISGPSGLCIGKSEIFTDPVLGGIWSAANGNVEYLEPDSNYTIGTGIIAGKDTIIYTSTNGCDTAIANLAVTIGFAGVAPITGLDSVCAGDSVVLSDSTSGGVWTVADASVAIISSTGVVTGLKPGSQTWVTYTLNNGCYSYTVFLIIVKTPGECGESVNGINNLTAIAVYPNPSTGALTIEMPAASGKGSITVYNLYGSIVAVKDYGANTGKVQLDLHNLPRGSYLVKVQNGAAYQSQKVVLE